jgi:FkbM family methyltransferase
MNPKYTPAGETMRRHLGRLWHEMNHLVEDASSYIICFGLAHSCMLYIRRLVRPDMSQRAVQVPVPGSEVKLLVRPGTSDVIVFNDVFHGKEHDWDLPVPPQVILDAGAYTGLSAAYFAMRYPQARVIALEPDEQNFALLNKNVASFKNVQTIKGALWNQSGALILTDPGSGSWSFRVSEPADSSSDPSSAASAPSVGSSVEAYSVPDIMRECGAERIDLLKLDIEGSEKEVLSDSDSWIKHVSAISIELHDRFKPGCSRAFFNAVSDFPIELRRGEKVLVARNDARAIHLS